MIFTQKKKDIFLWNWCFLDCYAVNVNIALSLRCNLKPETGGCLSFSLSPYFNSFKKKPNVRFLSDTRFASIRPIILPFFSLALNFRLFCSFSLNSYTHTRSATAISLFSLLNYSFFLNAISNFPSVKESESSKEEGKKSVARFSTSIYFHGFKAYETNNKSFLETYNYANLFCFSS